MPKNKKHASASWPDRVQAIATSVGIIVAVAGLIFSIVQTRQQLTQNSKDTRAQLNQSDQINLAQVYADAVDQLGSPQTQVRLGAVYTLIRIDAENEHVAPVASYHQAVISLLAAHIRSSSAPVFAESPGCTGQPLVERADAVDVRAAVEAIRELARPDDVLDLSNSCLTAADLHGAQLQNAKMYSTDLRASDLSGAHLTHALMNNAHLEFANLDTADLNSAVLIDVVLDCASGKGVNFTGVTITDNSGKIVVSAEAVNFPNAIDAPTPLNHVATDAEQRECTAALNGG